MNYMQIIEQVMKFIHLEVEVIDSHHLYKETANQIDSGTLKDNIAE